MTEEMKNTETAGAENTVSDPAAELQNMSFEDALAKLEAIVRELESGLSLIHISEPTRPY